MPSQDALRLRPSALATGSHKAPDRFPGSAPGPRPSLPASLLIPPVKEFVDETNTEEHAAAQAIAAEALKTLRAGLHDDVTISTVIDSGDPKQVLVRLAEEFGADCIFTGATGFSNRIERFILGSVSAAVAARAHCPVEVVREPQVP